MSTYYSTQENRWESQGGRTEGVGKKGLGGEVRHTPQRSPDHVIRRRAVCTECG
jgi:hypothetical protein